MDFVGVGDNVVDCYYDQGVYYPGGNAVNVAVRCKMNGCGRVGYIGIFADDEKGDYIKSCLSKLNIDWSHSRTVHGISGSPGVRLSASGDRVFVPGPKNTVQRTVALHLIDDDLDYLKQFPLCHTSCYSNIECELEKLSSICAVSFDFSEGQEESYILKFAPFVDYAFFSCSKMNNKEIQEIIEKCHDLGVGVVGCTLGSKGALFSDGKKMYKQEVIPTKVVDTMGAGDAFIAGFLTSYHEGRDMTVALNYAAKQASIACQCNGGWGYPHPLLK